MSKREDGTYYWDYDRPQSIGRVKAFYGNFGILVRAYTYIRTYGPEGLRRVSELAVLNANYMMHRLAPYYEVAYRACASTNSCYPAKTKRVWRADPGCCQAVLDFGYHPPTIYFPLNVEECIMIEPTESESKETLDGFIDTMIQIAKEAETTPEVVIGAPYTTVVKRLDETTAARKPVLNCTCG